MSILNTILQESYIHKIVKAAEKRGGTKAVEQLARSYNPEIAGKIRAIHHGHIRSIDAGKNHVQSYKKLFGNNNGIESIGTRIEPDFIVNQSGRLRGISNVPSDMRSVMVQRLRRKRRGLDY